MTIRKIIFWIHLIIGIIAGTIILIMSVTGVMLAFRPQLLAIVEQDRRIVTPPPGARALGVNELLDNVRKAYPDTKVRAVIVKADSNTSIVINMGPEKGNVYVNPYSGVVLGKESSLHDFFEGVELWHRWLGMEGGLKPIGHNIKGVANLFFVLMLITGIYLWWPVKNIRLKTALKGKARHWNQHNVIGFWCAPFLIIIALTGVIMSYQWANKLLFQLSGSPVPQAREAEARGKGEGRNKGKAQAIDMDALLVRAKQEVPGWTSLNLRLPQAEGPVTVFIEDQGSGTVHLRSQITLDAATVTVIKSELYSNQSRGKTWRAWARYLHTGEAGGFLGQVLACVASLGAILLVWTGFVMSWHRFFLKKLRI